MEAALVSGARACLLGLSKRPELNGCKGQLGAWHEASGRWEFVLDSSGESIRVRSENLQPWRDQTGGTADIGGERAESQPSKVSKGDVLFYRGKSCTVLTVSYATDPPHAVVRIADDGREVGVEMDHLVRQEAAPARKPRVLCLSSTTAGPRAIDRQLAGLRKASAGKVELLLAEGWNEPAWDWCLNEVDWSTCREALDWLQALLRDLHPIDVVLGFAHGADFAAMLAAQSALGVGESLTGVCLLGPHLPRYIGHFPELFAEDEPLQVPAFVASDVKEVEVESADPNSGAPSLPSEYVLNMFDNAHPCTKTVLVLENAAEAAAAAAHEVDGAVDDVVTFILGLARAASSRNTRVGDQVRLTGLDNCSKLSGRTGMVVGWDFKHGGWSVRLVGCDEPVLATSKQLEKLEPTICFKCGKSSRLKADAPICKPCWVSFRCTTCENSIGKWEDETGRLLCSRCLWHSQCAKCRAPASTKDEIGTAFCQECWDRFCCSSCKKNAGVKQEDGLNTCMSCWRNSQQAKCCRCKHMKGSEKDEAGNLYCSGCWSKCRCTCCGRAVAVTQDSQGRKVCSGCKSRCSVCGSSAGPGQNIEGRIVCEECAKSCRCVKCGRMDGKVHDDSKGNGRVLCDDCWSLQFCVCGEPADETETLEDGGKRFCRDCWVARLCVHCGHLARGHLDEKGDPCCSKCWALKLCHRCKKHVGNTRGEDGVLYCSRCWALRFCKECSRPACGRYDDEGQPYCENCWAEHRLQAARRLGLAQEAILGELLRRGEAAAGPALDTPTAAPRCAAAAEKAFLQRLRLGPLQRSLPAASAQGAPDLDSGPWLQSSSAQGTAILGGFELTSNFEGGNALPESWRLDSKEGKVPTLHTRIAHDCHNQTHSRSKTFWFNFGITPMARETLTRNPNIRLAVHGMSSQETLFEDGYAPVVWTPTRQVWSRVETELDYHREKTAYEEEKNSKTTYTLAWTHVFGQDDANKTTYFAFCYPFSFADLQHCLARLEVTLMTAGHSKVTKSKLKLGCLHGPHAACTCAWGEAGTHPGGEQDLPTVGSNIYFHRQIIARTPQGRCVEVVTVTEAVPNTLHVGDQLDVPEVFPMAALGGWPSSPPQRFKGRPVIFVSARVHPGETPGQFAALGLLRFFCSSDPRAALLRAQYVLKLVPMLNPDGVAWGHSRVSSRGHDLNRCYQDPSPEEHEGVAAVKALLNTFSERGELEFYVDCHAHAGVRGCFLYGNTQEEGFVQNVAYAHLAQLNCPHLDLDKCLWSTAPKQEAGRVTVHQSFGLVHAYTLECNYHAGRLARPVAAPPGLPSCCEKVQEIRGPRMGSSRFAPVPFDPCAWGAVGEALAVSILDLHRVNPHSRLLVSKPPKLLSANSSERGHSSDLMGLLTWAWEELAKRHQEGLKGTSS